MKEHENLAGGLAVPRLYGGSSQSRSVSPISTQCQGPLNNDYLLLAQHLITRAYLAGVPTGHSLWLHVTTALDDAWETHSAHTAHSNYLPDVDIDIQDIHTEQYNQGCNYPEYLAKASVEASFKHPIALRYPRNHEHAKTILEWFKSEWSKRNWGQPLILKTIENDFASITEDPQELSYKTYLGLYEDESTCIYKTNSTPSGITLLEANGIIRGTTGLTTWSGSGILASWASNNPNLFKGSRILELGSGIGYSLIAMLTQFHISPPIISYTATDCHPHVLTVLKHNLELLQHTQETQLLQCNKSDFNYTNLSLHRNMLSAKLAAEELPPGEIPSEPWNIGPDITIQETRVRIQQIDWRTPGDLPDVDIIVAADVVYAIHLIEPLVSLIKSILIRSGVKNKEENQPIKTDLVPGVAYIACTRRNQETISLFLTEILTQGLSYKLIYQATLDSETSLFGYNEGHLPVKIYKIVL